MYSHHRAARDLFNLLDIVWTLNYDQLNFSNREFVFAEKYVTLVLKSYVNFKTKTISKWFHTTIYLRYMQVEIDKQLDSKTKL